MTEPQDKPRSWLPLIIAGSIAVLVVVGAVITHLVRADLSPQKSAAVEACESELEEQFPGGPGIVGGDIYSATEWKALDATLVRLGYAEDAELSGEQADSRDSEAAALVSAGNDTMTLVWQLDDQSNSTCVAHLKGDTVTEVVITPLAVPGASPSPTPSPSD